jgi:hypothetical protein
MSTSYICRLARWPDAGPETAQSIESLAVDPARRAIEPGAAESSLKSAYARGVDAFFSELGDPLVVPPLGEL